VPWGEGRVAIGDNGGPMLPGALEEPGSQHRRVIKKSKKEGKLSKKSAWETKAKGKTEKRKERDGHGNLRKKLTSIRVKKKKKIKKIHMMWVNERAVNNPGDESSHNAHTPRLFDFLWAREGLLWLGIHR